MIIPIEKLVDDKCFRELLIVFFPEIETDIEDDEVILHMEMSALERLANQYIKSGNFTGLNRTYDFIGDLARHQKDVHPDVINAMNVSFLEGLDFENENNGEKAKELMPRVLLQMWDAQYEHNKKIGWLK